ncbi:methyltransferase domain-containing protein [Actinosynnema sp. CS-041913]|uniref:methyltransferase domain-containing protein n=1 Tax=Actinosynnema sp. CS-041913 TaxID=3239917 RepID=UPI003D8AA4A3
MTASTATPRRVVGMLPRSARDLLLLVGSGVPALDAALRARYPAALLVIASPWKEHRPDSATLAVRADPRHLPMPAGRFDVVLTDSMMADHPVPDDVVREVARVLRPGGAFALVVPDDGTADRPRTAAVVRLLVGNGFRVPLIARERRQVPLSFLCAVAYRER